MKHSEYIRDVKNAKTAILFMHGILGTPDHFNEFVNLVPNTYAVHNILLDGHGKGVDEFSKTSMKKWKSQAESKFIELSQKYDKVILVAHSMGTLFSIDLANKYPDKIEHMFLIAVPLKIMVKPLAVKISLTLMFKKNVKKEIYLSAKNGCSVALSAKFWKYAKWLPNYFSLFYETKKTCKAVDKLSVACKCYQSKKDELVSKNSVKYFDNVNYVFLPNSHHFYYDKADMEFMKKEFLELLNH